MMLRHDGARGPVTILGLSFKENVPDIRNSKVLDIVRELEGFGVAVQVHDTMTLPEEAEREYGLRLLPREALAPAAAVVFAGAHDRFVAEGWRLIGAPAERHRHRSRRQGAIAAHRAARRHRVIAALTSARFRSLSEVLESKLETLGCPNRGDPQRSHPFHNVSIPGK